MKVALVYDRVNKWGGAERVLLTLHEMFPDAPLFTSVYNSATAKWAEVFPQVIPSFLQKVPYARSHHEYFAGLMPFAFEQFNFDGFDYVISVTSEAAKGIVTSPRTKHICYLLTPTRYLWSGHKEYFESKIFRTMSSPMVFYLRKWDKHASTRPDILVSISTETQKRVKKYYKKNVEKIYPPVEIKKFKLNKKIKRKNFFLVVSRLVKYKKVDLVIDAFNEMPLPLIVVGDGSEKKDLVKRAKSNIKFISNISDDELVKYYQSCKAFLFPQVEDFGLVAVEAQAGGAPVIAFKKGGALDIIKDKETGIFFDTQDKISIINATKRLMKTKFDNEYISSQSERFSKERFVKEFNNLLNLNI